MNFQSLASYCLFVCASLWLGCSRPSASSGIQITSDGRIPTVLLSEVMVNGTLKTIECPIQIQNTARDNRQFRLAGTGCSCYGVWLDDRKLTAGQVIDIGSGDTLELSIRAQSANRQTQRKFNADFEILDAKDNARGVRVDCSLQIYQDLKVSPRVLECSTMPFEDSLQKRSVSIERIFRSDSGKTPAPELFNPPDGIAVTSVTEIGRPNEIEPGLWKAAWKIELAIDVSRNVSSQGQNDDLNFEFDFHGIDNLDQEEIGNFPIAPTSVSTKLRRKLRVPVAFPSSIHFGTMKPGDTRERSFFLSGIDGREFMVSTVDDVPKGIEVATPEQIASSHRINVSLSADEISMIDSHTQSSGEITHTLKLDTNLKEQPMIEIELKAYLDRSNEPESKSDN